MNQNNTNTPSSEERHCFEMIRRLQEEYTAAIQPYIDRLAYIKSLDPPRPIFIPAGEAERVE